MASTNWYVYIIETECGMLYTGITTNLDRRFSEHQGDKGKGKGAKFFRGRKARLMHYAELMENRSMASKREYAIKKLSAAGKRMLFDQPENLRKKTNNG